MLYDKLKDYSEGDVYPFHMPGHKRCRINSELPYELDLTEIPGFDYLHDPHGCIRDVEYRAEKLYGVKRAFLLVNGATGGILSAVRAMTNPGEKVLIARNCHKSVYNAAEICGLKPVYYLPDNVSESDIIGSVNPFVLDRMLYDDSDIGTVIITSPTYEGVCSDIELIADICHRHGTKLFVDEAHGAHFPFSDEFPMPAMQCGADASVVSLHKTLPAPTQTALLLTNNVVLEKELQRQLSVFETSSPSYLLMCGIEKCLEYIEDYSFKEYISLLNDFYSRAKALKKLKIFYDPDDDCVGNLSDYDIGKIVITTYHAAINGRQLANILRERYQIETEMSAAQYVIAVTSVCDIKEGFERLINALFEIDKAVDYSDKELKTFLFDIPEARFEISQTYKFDAKTIGFTEAAGEASLEYIYAYPPGIPLVVPGEVISEEIIETVKAMRVEGVEVTSTYHNLPERIAVADL